MKKILALVLTLVLCMMAAASALASAVPSKTVNDMTSVSSRPQSSGTSDAETEPEPGLLLTVVTEDDPRYEATRATVEQEIQKLAAAKDPSDYFVEVVDRNGNPVSLKELLGSDDLKVYEFDAIIASGYEEMGLDEDVAVELRFATPYAQGEKVLVTIGVPVTAADGTPGFRWTVFEGEGLGASEDAGLEGGVLTTLSPEIIRSIEQGGAMMAVVSKGDGVTDEGDENGLLLKVVTEDDPRYEATRPVVEQETQKLAAAKEPSDYFVEVVDRNGNPVSMKELLGIDELQVKEFDAIIAGGYANLDLAGDITTELGFETIYEEGEKVLVAIGVPVTAADGTNGYRWTVFEGEGLGANEAAELKGGVRVTLSPEIVLAIEQGGAMMAVVSK